MADHATTYSDKFVYHEPGLQHQFEDMKQQEESVSIGMWMFLVQEIMFFGGMFTVYLVFRSRFPMAFATGSNHLNVVMGFANTLVLIVSSLTMALTVYFAHRQSAEQQASAGIGVSFDWDIDLLSGYRNHFLTNVSRRPSTTEDTIAVHSMRRDSPCVNALSILILSTGNRVM